MPARVIAVGPGELAHGPQLLPDGNWVLFTFRPSSQDSWTRRKSLRSRSRRASGSCSSSATRRAVHPHRTSCARAEWSAARCPVRRARTARHWFRRAARRGCDGPDVRTGAMHFSVERRDAGVSVGCASGERSTLSWANRNGRSDPLSADALTYSSPRVSPDGTRVAVEVASREGVDIHIYDLTRKTLTRLTSSSSTGRYPLWTPNSQRVVFYPIRTGADSTRSRRMARASRRVSRHLGLFRYLTSWTDGGKIPYRTTVQ